MATELTLPEASEFPGASVSLADVMRYASILGRIIVTLKAVENLAPQGSQDLDTIKFSAGNKEFSWNPGEITREK